MYQNIDDMNIYYKVEGNGKDLILLHGWGLNLETFNKLNDDLKYEYKVYRIDLPGFGKSVINKPLSILEVTDVLHKFINKMKIENPILIGHSYGGRIGIVYSSMYSVDKLVLISTPGIKHKLNWDKRVRIRLYKVFKRLGINLNIGSNDYKNSSDINKKMLVKTVNHDLTVYMNSIECPTLLLYGRNDKITSVSLGMNINKEIKSSTLIVLDDCGHFPYIERFNYFILVLKSYLGDNHAC